MFPPLSKLELIKFGIFGLTFVKMIWENQRLKTELKRSLDEWERQKMAKYTKESYQNKHSSVVQYFKKRIEKNH